MRVRANRTKIQAAWCFPKPAKKNLGGRPKIKDRRASEAHQVRPALHADHPVHVTMRVVKAVGNLRTRLAYKAIRRATLHAAAVGRIRIIHFSIQHDHLHAIVEAEGREALARGMQGFQISAARHLNRACERDGTVFADRYHAKQQTAPKMARNAIAYVLNNWRKHREDRRAPFDGFRVDPYSSAINFDGWKNYDAAKARTELPPTYLPLVVAAPSTWLLRIGWKRHPLVDVYEVPSATIR